MAYRVTSRVCFQTPDIEQAKAHFQRALGMTVVSESEDSVELAGGDLRLFIDRGPQLGPIMELLVPDADLARDDLVGQGWTVVLWEGRGGRRYLRNPMGMLFDLSEDPGAFDVDAEGGADG